MAISWEYKRAWASFNEGTHPGKSETELKKLASEAWIKLLNDLGESGWELVTERTALGGIPAVKTFWIEYSGTMKRPRS